MPHVEMKMIAPGNAPLRTPVRVYFIGEKSVGFSNTDFTPSLTVSGPPPVFAGWSTWVGNAANTGIREAEKK